MKAALYTGILVLSFLIWRLWKALVSRKGFPNKKQRHEIYIEALKIYENRKSAFMCRCILKAAWDKHFSIEEADVLKAFPEFAAHRPKRLYDESDCVWFDPYQRTVRRQILKKCIERTAR